jgi:hypothetical protein
MGAGLLQLLAVGQLGFEPDNGQLGEEMGFGHPTNVPSTTGDGSQRFLFASMHSSLGFGDQMRWYYDQLLIAKLLGRVLILPDMHWSRQHYDAAAKEKSSELAAVR